MNPPICSTNFQYTNKKIKLDSEKLSYKSNKLKILQSNFYFNLKFQNSLIKNFFLSLNIWYFILFYYNIESLIRERITPKTREIKWYSKNMVLVSHGIQISAMEKFAIFGRLCIRLLKIYDNNRRII